MLTALRFPTLAALLLAVPAVAEDDLAGFSPAFLDPAQDPCQDFYQYACGGWLESHPIPADRSAWDRYDQLEEVNRAQLKEILEQAVAKPSDAGEKRLGDFYTACMDEAAVEKLGLAPLAAELKRIAAVHDADSLAAELAHLHAIGGYVGFDLYSVQDPADATKVIAEIDQGGLSLPDPSDYLGHDARAVERQQRYRQHIAAMLRLAGEGAEQATADAERAWKVESALAKASMTAVERRDPHQRHHPVKLADLPRPFAWKTYLEASGVPRAEPVNVAAPAFLEAFARLTQSEDVKSWRAYFTWQLLDASAKLLPSALVQEDFEFYGRYLRGAKALEDRSKLCGRRVDRDLGQAVGQLYVARHFPAQRKQLMVKLVGRLEKAMGADFRSVDWLTPATRQQALEKLKRLRLEVGYPSKWRSFDALQVSRSDALGNHWRARQLEREHDLAKIGKPVDRDEWPEPPQIVDGYHSSELNEVVFTAGILQPPFLDPERGEPVVFGEVGRMIGHELTHAFDDQGRKFDGGGNLRDWWTAKDAEAYEQRAQCFADEYARFVAVGDVHLDGRLTLGENIADNGGLRLAYQALAPVPAPAPKGGFSAEQLFFLGFAQSQCGNTAEKTARDRAKTDPHSPHRWRVNGSVQNMPEFARAFRCKAGAPMAPEHRCRVW